MLKNRFEELKNEQPRYSLRKFATEVGIVAPTLSHILKGKRSIGEKDRKRILRYLNLDPATFDSLEKNTNDLSSVPWDIFEIMSDWYFDAIREMINLEDFQADPKWIAKRLRLPEVMIKRSLELLFEHQVIKEGVGSRWVVDELKTEVLGKEQTNETLKKLQSQLLDKAQSSLEKVPKENREQLSLTISINTRDLPEVKKRMKKFALDLMDFTQRRDNKHDEVYQAILSFFPLSFKDSAS